MIRRWARAGVRADPDEARRHQLRIQARALQSRLRTEAGLKRAQAGWARGLIRPWYITRALDLRGLDGPEVDVACLAQEPDVDNWEAGLLYPRFDQLLALAELTEFQPWWFVMEHDPGVELDRTSLRFHLPPSALVYEPPVLSFTPEALRDAGIRNLAPVLE